jgi:hypothetical protein
MRWKNKLEFLAINSASPVIYCLIHPLFRNFSYNHQSFDFNSLKLVLYYIKINLYEVLSKKNLKCPIYGLEP